MRDPEANYRSDYRARQNDSAQCFNGKMVVGLNRLGEKTLFVQAATGAIYELTVPQGCPDLDDARKLTLSSNGGKVVCAGQDADMFARTASGTKRCSSPDLRPIAQGSKHEHRSARVF